MSCKPQRATGICSVLQLFCDESKHRGYIWKPLCLKITCWSIKAYNAQHKTPVLTLFFHFSNTGTDLKDQFPLIWLCFPQWLHTNMHSPCFCTLPLPQFCVLRVPGLQRPAIHHGVWKTQRRLPALEELGFPLPDPKDPVHQTHQAMSRNRSGGVPVSLTPGRCVLGPWLWAKSLHLSFGSEFKVLFIRGPQLQHKLWVT